jgi:peptide/nickel transport system substrate-binding protein
MRQRSGSRLLAAVLFTDIVDSSAVASRVGDARWKVLIARHHGIVRRELKRFGGRELDTAGDGFYASFGEPAAAIRCACAASESVRELGIEIRAGVHFGECEQLKEKLGGIAVVVGARVMSLGGAGDVLVTASTSSLVAGAGFGFTDRGEHSLKGVDGQWHVLAVSEVDGEPRPQPAPPEEAEDRLAEVRPSALRPRTGRLMAIAAAFLVVVALVAVPVTRRSGGSSEIAPNSIGVLDPESGELSSTIAMPSGPGAITAGSGSLWVANPDAATVTRIDEGTKVPVDTIHVGVDPAGIAAEEDAVWVVESGGPTVSRISPDTNEVVGDPIGVGNGPAGVAVGEGSVWVTNRFDGTVSKIDPDKGAVGEVVERISVGLDPSGIAVGFGSVWVALAGSNQVVRVDPQTNEVASPIDVGNAPASLVVSPDAVWVVNRIADTVSRIDPETNLEVEAIPVGDGPSGIAFVEGAVWVANGSDGTLSRIDPGSNAVSPAVRIGSIPQGLATAAESLWVTVRGTATSHLGGTLRLVSTRDNMPSSLDPGVSYLSSTWSILVIVGDGLVGFKRVGGVDGATLVPDLAVSLPTPTDDGKTYRFQLRPGIAYSNGEIVVASDFRRAIEREFPLKDVISGESIGANYFGVLVGGEACSLEPKTCDLSRGIETDDDANTITFHLLRPDPEFLYKLAMPLGFPVPASTPDEEQIRAGVPGTGPYRLEAPMTPHRLVLVRNEHFHQWSVDAQPAGNVDRIEWAFGGTPDKHANAVASGHADFMGFPFETPSQIEDLRVRFAGQVYEHPTMALYYLSLNTKLPPFNDADVRRALNLAVDRQKLVEIFGSAAVRLTCQVLAPGFPGYEPYCPYTIDPGPRGQWTEPDMDQAQHLVKRSGTAGTHVTFWYEPYEQAQAEYFVHLLKNLDFDAQLRSTSNVFAPLSDPDRGVQIAPAGWNIDYLAPSNFIAPLVTCDSIPAPNYGGFCNKDIDRMIELAARIPTEDAAASHQAWVEVDHAITDQAPIVPFANPNDFDFVSERVGNYQYNPQWGLLFAQVWVQ